MSNSHSNMNMATLKYAVVKTYSQRSHVLSLKASTPAQSTHHGRDRGTCGMFSSRQKALGMIYQTLRPLAALIFNQARSTQTGEREREREREREAVQF